MNTRSGGDGLRWLAAVAFFLAPIAAAALPRLNAAFFPILSIVVILAAAWHKPRWTGVFLPRTVFVGCAVLSSYVFLATVWAWHPDAGLAKAALLLGLIVLIFAVSTAVTALSERQTRTFSWAFVAGATIAALYLLVDLLSCGEIVRYVYNTVPAVRPDGVKRIKIVGDVVTYINLSALNLGVTSVMLNMWPALLMLAAFLSGRRRWIFMAAFFAVTAIAICVSKHSSSQVALVASVLIFGLAWKWHRIVIPALAVLWCLAFVVVLPASFVVHDMGFHEDKSVPHSYRARIVLWEYTAEKTLEHPWLGVGVNTTREKDAARLNKGTGANMPRDGKFRRITGQHSHNLFLQTWRELGAVGAILFALAGALVVFRIGALPRNVLPYAAASFTAFASIAAFAWGMWQAWWMCAVGLMTLYLCLGNQLTHWRSEPSPGSDALAHPPHS